MMPTELVTGAPDVRAVVVSGRGEAAAFVAVPWVFEQLRSHLGRDPFPGTLNLALTDVASRAAWHTRSAAGTVCTVVAQEDGYCAASLFPILLAGLRCAVVLPHVPDYPADVLEVVATDPLRQRLGFRDGDEVMVSFLTPGPVEGRFTKTTSAVAPIANVITDE